MARIVIETVHDLREGQHIRFVYGGRSKGGEVLLVGRKTGKSPLGWVKIQHSPTFVRNYSFHKMGGITTD